MLIVSLKFIVVGVELCRITKKYNIKMLKVSQSKTFMTFGIIKNKKIN